MAKQLAKAAERGRTTSPPLEEKGGAEAKGESTAVPEGTSEERKRSLLAHIAKLEMLAARASEAALETFDSADIDAKSPLQAVAFKREGVAMTKGYASILASIERLREAVVTADS